MLLVLQCPWMFQKLHLLWKLLQYHLYHIIKDLHIVVRIRPIVYDLYSIRPENLTDEFKTIPSISEIKIYFYNELDLFLKQHAEDINLINTIWWSIILVGNSFLQKYTDLYRC